MFKINIKITFFWIRSKNVVNIMFCMLCAQNNVNTTAFQDLSGQNMLDYARPSHIWNDAWFGWVSAHVFDILFLLLNKCKCDPIILMLKQSLRNKPMSNEDNADDDLHAYTHTYIINTYTHGQTNLEYDMLFCVYVLDVPDVFFLFGARTCWSHTCHATVEYAIVL